MAGLRSIALGFGDRLEKLALSQTPLTDTMLMVLASRFFALRELEFAECILVSSAAMRFVVEGCHRTLASMKLSRCCQLKDEAVAWLAGDVGFATPACSSLRVLCLDQCKFVGNRALKALGKGCRQLR